ncbi:hypothetical protein SO694_00027269 [Aureococcus anophagefferens]|uniref:ATP-grasp domain-containing protein n=1 Tax=Aureococcus anophagefferens TaxID=44056 RepID=A0ABR1FUR8_AURAN
MGRGGERALKTPDDAFIDLGAFATLAVALPATLLLTWLLTVSWAENWGRRTYVAARFAYADGALFDGTPLTYGTDYVLAAWCAYLGVRATTNVPPGAPSRATRLRLRRLMFKYAVQCLLGGLAHHAHDGTAAYLNRWTFRLLWTAVVGCVASSGADLFAIAEGLRFVPPAGPLRDLARVARLSPAAADAWGLALWLLTALGAFSCTRPAGDIFAVGVTQSPATAALILAILARPRPGVAVASVGLVLNVPLVFAYPFAVWSGLGLGTVNGLLHAWLAVAWGSQGLGLARFCDGAPTRTAVRARERALSAGAEDNGAVAAFAAPDADAVGAAVVVDPLCDYLGLALARELLDRGVAVATVLSDYVGGGLCDGGQPPPPLRAPAASREAPWLEAADAPPLLACFSESDAGIATAERLGRALDAAFANGDGVDRRHKWLLHEKLRDAGLPHCAQALCDTAEDVVAFQKTHNTIVVKPCRGVGSDGVFKCETAAECREAFDALRATTRYGGGFNDVVLAQAFLAGVEYAVDSVSRDGEHKVTALWRYDKRPANGGAFVYRGTWLADAAGAGAVLETLRACLDALGHANGPAHSELIVGDDGAATLVEVNARFHNANVRPLVAACVAGPDAIAAAAAACLPSADEWDAIAADPTLERAGVLAHLVSAVEGPLAAVDGDALARLRSLPTLVDHELYVDEPGGAMVKTVDIKTDSGWALLAGPEAAVAADYAAIQDLQYELFRVDS